MGPDEEAMSRDEADEVIEYVAVNQNGDSIEITQCPAHDIQALYECTGVEYAQADLPGGVSIVEMTMDLRTIEGIQFKVPVLFHIDDFVSIHEFQATYITRVTTMAPDGTPRNADEADDAGRTD